jgi:hypothetical protein
MLKNSRLKEEVTLFNYSYRPRRVILRSIHHSGQLMKVLQPIDQKVRKRELTIGERDEVIASILGKTRDLLESGYFRLIAPTRKILSKSTRLIVERHLSADDSLQLMTALELGKCLFVSSDARLNAAAKAEGLTCFNAEEESEMETLLLELNIR